MEKYWVQPHSEAQVRWVSAFRTYLLVSRDNFLVYSFWRVYKWWKWLCSIAWKGVVLPLLLESYAVVLKKQCNDNNCGSNRPYIGHNFKLWWLIQQFSILDTLMFWVKFLKRKTMISQVGERPRTCTNMLWTSTLIMERDSFVRIERGDLITLHGLDLFVLFIGK